MYNNDVSENIVLLLLINYDKKQIHYAHNLLENQWTMALNFGRKTCLLILSACDFFSFDPSCNLLLYPVVWFIL